jgi:GDPmannose 4,6-dehydratase
MGLQDKIVLGNLNAVRDWGYAPEYVEAMWLMLQQDVPGNFVIATGETATVKDFLKASFEVLNLDYQKYTVSDEKYFRPSEVNYLQGNSEKANKELKWSAKTNWIKLANKMVLDDLEILKKSSN